VTEVTGTSSNAHTYRLLIVKELIRYCLAVFCESFCSSAAEEEEYEAFRLTRQPHLFQQRQRYDQTTLFNTLIMLNFSVAAEAGGEL
jgi:hypothetical protein